MHSSEGQKVSSYDFFVVGRKKEDSFLLIQAL